MIKKITMPKVDANIEEATVGQWLKSEGEWVEKGEQLVELITDKANFELESETSGYLRKIIAEEKSVVPTGYVLALLSDEPDEELIDVTEENNRIIEEYRAKVEHVGDVKYDDTERSPVVEKDREKPGRVRATPSARKLARKMKINLADIPNPENKILTEQDVKQYISSLGEEGKIEG